MKVGKIHVMIFISALIIIARVFLKLAYPDNGAINSAFVTGLTVGALFVFGLYYLNIYYTAWVNSKSEDNAEANKSSL